MTDLLLLPGDGIGPEVTAQARRIAELVIADPTERALVQGQIRCHSLGNAARLGGHFRPDPIAGQEQEVGHLGYLSGENGFGGDLVQADLAVE